MATKRKSYIITDSSGRTFKVQYVPSTKLYHCNGSVTFYGFSFEEVLKRQYKR